MCSLCHPPNLRRPVFTKRRRKRNQSKRLRSQEFLRAARGCPLCQRNEYSEWRTRLFHAFSRFFTIPGPKGIFCGPDMGGQLFAFCVSKNPLACKTVMKEMILIQRSESKMVTQKILMALRVMVKLRLLLATPPRRSRLGYKHFQISSNAVTCPWYTDRKLKKNLEVRYG